MKFVATAKTYGVGDFKLPATKGETKLLAKSAQSALDAAAIAPLPLPDNLAEIIPSDLKWVEVILSFLPRHPDAHGLPPPAQTVNAVDGGGPAGCSAD